MRDDVQVVAYALHMMKAAIPLVRTDDWEVSDAAATWVRSVQWAHMEACDALFRIRQRLEG